MRLHLDSPHVYIFTKVRAYASPKYALKSTAYCIQLHVLNLVEISSYYGKQWEFAL